MKESVNLLWCAGLVFFCLLIKDSSANDARVWTHANGKSIAGTLKEFKDDEVVIVFGDREIRVKVDDLSPKDRRYLLKISDQSKDDQPESHDQLVKEGGDGKTRGEIKSDLDVKPFAVKKDIPKKMIDFVNLVSSLPLKYNEAKNELQKSALRTERQEKLRKLFVDRSAEKWVGRIAGMGTDSNRNAVLRLSLNTTGVTADDSEIVVITISNKMSPIKHGSDFYNRLASYETGDVVIFSGEFIESKEDHLLETSITEWGSVNYPDFEFKFSEVLKAD
jgi:hypothetical protein